MAIDLKELKFYVNYTGKKLKTDGLTLNQNSSNNVIDFICMDQYDVVEIYFKNPAGQISPKYHMINNGIYQKSTDDLEVSEIADNTFHEWKFAIPYAITSFTMTSSTARMEVSFAGYKYDAGNKLVISSTANTQIIVNKSNTSDSLDESYNGTDVENLWKAIGTISEGKQDKLPTVINGRYLHTNETTGELEWSIVQGGSGSGTQYDAGDGINIEDNTISVDTTVIATKDYVDTTKQDKLTAGQNITISANGTISATTSPTYTAGTGIVIQGNRIEVDQSEISYNNIANTPAAPGTGVLTIQKNGSTIDTFSANATSGKTVNITVPTKTSDLTNDSSYVTTTQLADKQDRLTSANAGPGINISRDGNDNVIITNTSTSGIEIISVDTLPTASADTYGKIYLTPSATSEANNVKYEYITILSSGVYSWELIGNTDVDLSGYYTSEQIDAAFYNKSQTNSLLNNYYPTTNPSGYQNATQVQSAINSSIAGKQDSFGLDTTWFSWDDTQNPHTLEFNDPYTANHGVMRVSNNFRLRPDFYRYLMDNAFDHPTITLILLDDQGNPITNTAMNIGDTVTVGGFRHLDTNVDNLNGTLTLKRDGVAIMSNINPTPEGALSSDITISPAIEFTAGPTSFVLTGVEAETGNAISSNQVEFTFTNPVTYVAYGFASYTDPGNRIVYNNTFTKTSNFTPAVVGDASITATNRVNITRTGAQCPYIISDYPYTSGLQLVTYFDAQGQPGLVSEWQSLSDNITPRQITFVDENNVEQTMYLYGDTGYDAGSASYTEPYSIGRVS